jgi:hypothetical protein
MPGNTTIEAVPLVDNQLKQCIIKAKSALDLGANTPAGENLGSFINTGFASPSQ